jgi:hypothetical protein
MGAKKTFSDWGKVQGFIEVPAALLERAYGAGQAAYEQAVKDEFCGDEVTWLPEEPWQAELEALVPADAVQQLGFELAPKGQFRVYSTHGTDPHTDGEGAVFVLVLANDGLKFKQGKQNHVTNVGEWYVFDDRRTHTVNASRSSTSYVFLHRQLKAVG